MTNWRHHLPIIAIVLALGWSALMIALRRSEDAPPETMVIRIGHWQLEAGVREAFEVLGREFATLPEIRTKYGKVQVIQDAIPDSTYGQWLTSQMMGRTAPDLLEVGKLPDPILLAYQARYFLPLTEMASRPNPFNRGTPMEKVAFKETFLDGMRSGYQEELQAYMRVPLSRLTTRVFYNKTLLRRLTGAEKPPEELRAFLELCRRIGEEPLPKKMQRYIPIANSAFHTAYWFQNVTEPLTFANVFVADYLRDGSVGSDETFAAMINGRMHLSDLPWKARFDLTRKLAEQCNPDFVGVGRDEALFLFAQEKAVFISTGIWDVGSLQAQAEGKFEVGIANFPRPSPDDPEYGRLALGPLFDPAWAQFPFGIYRLSKHPELARDFLLFLASVKGNEQLNRIIKWIPSIAGVPLPAEFGKFAPVDSGIYAAGSLVLGGNTLVAFNKWFSEFQANPTYTFEQFQKDFLPTYLSEGKSEWQEQQRDRRRLTVSNEKFLAALRGEALLHDALQASGQSERAATGAHWIAYRSLTAQRQILPEIEIRQGQELVTKGPDRPVAPYDYLPEALEYAKAHLKKSN